ncbi:MAG: ParB/RepB/Spo0J family partition protein [Microthrixaceae bacterium]
MPPARGARSPTENSHGRSAVSSKGGLGRGLTSDSPRTTQGGLRGAGGGLLEVPTGSVQPNPNQPRRHFDEEGIDELAASMRELGSPAATSGATPDDGDDGYVLIAGERRLRAARRRAGAGPRGGARHGRRRTLEEALVENLHREDLNALEEAAAYQRLIEEFGYTQERIADRVGRSRSGVANLLRLFQLTPAVQKLVGDGLISSGQAKVLLSHPDRSYQEALAKRAVSESLTVRQLEDLIRERRRLESGSASVEDEADEPAPSGGDKAEESSRAKLRQPGLVELEELLAGHLDTRVTISMSSKRGKVTIDFADLEDLERIYRLIIEGS